MAYLLVLIIMLTCDSTGQPLYNNLGYEESVDNTLTCYAEFYSKSIILYIKVVPFPRYLQNLIYSCHLAFYVHLQCEMKAFSWCCLNFFWWKSLDWNVHAFKKLFSIFKKKIDMLRSLALIYNYYWSGEIFF